MMIHLQNKKILVTATELKRASIPGSKEYQELRHIMQAFPDYQIVRKSNPSRRVTTPSPAYAFVKDYLSTNTEWFDEFRALHPNGCNYFEIKKWFMTKFPAAFDCMTT